MEIDIDRRVEMNKTILNARVHNKIWSFQCVASSKSTSANFAGSFNNLHRGKPKSQINVNILPRILHRVFGKPMAKSPKSGIRILDADRSYDVSLGAALGYLS